MNAYNKIFFFFVEILYIDKRKRGYGSKLFNLNEI